MRIAMIAMSGVRAFDPDLTRLGLTLPGFIERGKAVAALPSLGLLTLAGMTPDRHEITYHEIADLETADQLPACDLAVVSTFTAQARNAYRIASRYRADGIPTVIGGLHATAAPLDAARWFDAVVAGEGEPVWLQVLRDAEEGRLGGIYRPQAEFDLANSPMPRFDLLEPDRYNRFTVQTTRGCPWRCEFCASSILLTNRYKKKPVERVIAEIREIKRRWPHPFIEFADDNSFVDREHSKNLLRAVAAEGVRWFTETDISVADDEELLDLMRDSGCMQVLIGLESPTAAALDGLERRRNWKLRRLDDYRRAIERIQSRGIAVNGCFVLGLDGATVDEFDAVRAFIEESGLYEVQITVMTAMPGTPLYSRLEAEGRLLQPNAWETCTVFDVNIQPTGMSVDDLREGFRSLVVDLYSEDAKKRRASAFRRQRRQGLLALQTTGG
jgi:radical SAM superfamily enzyme YgiQ (UPF0313 family)